MHPSKFQIYKGADGQYHFSLQSGEGKTICTSTGYSSTKDCRQGINTMKKVVFAAGIEEVTALEPGSN